MYRVCSEIQVKGIRCILSNTLVSVVPLENMANRKRANQSKSRILGFGLQQLVKASVCLCHQFQAHLRVIVRM